MVDPSMASRSLSQVPLLILAGGKGTRLKNLSAHTPKYLMPVSDRETFADLHLQWARQQGFRKVILSVGHLAEAIENYCGQGQKWDLQIDYLHDGQNPQGTGGAVALALKYEFEDLAITYGDTLLSLNAADLHQQIVTQKASGLMTIYPLDIQGHQANSTKEGAFVRYRKKDPSPAWKYIDYGFLFLKRNLIETFPTERPLDLALPLEQFSFKNLLLAEICPERFWEIGSPESLQEFQTRFQKAML